MQAKREIPSGKFTRLEMLQQRLYQDFFEVSEEIGRLKAELEWEGKTALEIARQEAKGDTISQKEAARILNVSVSALSRKVNHLECVLNARVVNGGKIEYTRVVVERHRANILAGKKCDNCYLITELSIHTFKKK